MRITLIQSHSAILDAGFDDTICILFTGGAEREPGHEAAVVSKSLPPPSVLKQALRGKNWRGVSQYGEL